MSELQISVQKAYRLPENEQNALAKMIDIFVSSLSLSKSSATTRNIGQFDGEFEVADDIDTCNDEIAEMFGVKE